MRKLIFIFLLAIISPVLSNETALVKLDSAWLIDNKTRMGSRYRIPATQQNPLPYCFSTAASMLYDQTMCSASGRQCKLPKTSFLAITQAGQNLVDTQKLNPQRGGSPIRSLEYLINTGPVLDDVCNYKSLSPIYGLNRLVEESKNVRDSWLRYRDRAPYLTNFYKYRFKTILQEINPGITQEQVEELLTQNWDIEKLTYKTLLSPACFNKLSVPLQFTIKFLKVNPENILASYLEIEKLLKQKKPVIINFCTTVSGSTPCIGNQLHSLVIVAQAKAVHTITKDTRTVYWLVNSWGEEWQEKNSDGWVYADKLLEALTGEIIWLESKQ